jgi:alpha-L-rhamnosidase
VRADHGHLNVGVLGSKAIFRALAENGRQDVAYEMLTKTTYPSYGFWIRHGATTLWENWSALPGSMDHIMFGDVNGWFYNDLVGIKPTAANPGWGTILFHPRPVRTLGWAHACVLSRFGRIFAGWKWRGPRLLIRLVIPPGSAGQVVLPTSRNAAVSCNGKPLAEVTGPWLKLTASGDKELSLPKGKYHFAYLPSGSRKLK